MTVTSTDFTVVFRVSGEGIHSSHKGLQICGSVAGIGSWNVPTAPLMEYDKISNEWSYILQMSHAVPSIQYQFLVSSFTGEVLTDLERQLNIPEEFRRLGDFPNPARVVIEVRTSLSRPTSRVSIYTPESVMRENSSVLRERVLREGLLGMKTGIENLRREKEMLRHELANISRSFTTMFDGAKVGEAAAKVISSKLVIKQLLTEINELKGKVKVVCRFRPLVDTEDEMFYFERDRTNISIPCESEFRTSGPYSSAALHACRDFQLDEVMDEGVGNEEFFVRSKIKNLIESSVLISNHICVFAYGQTGSGKSHTMLGSGSERGLVEMAVETILHARSNPAISLEIELLEIYREHVFPLVKPQRVSGSGEILSLFHEGIRQRATAATNLNATSSRSHCVFRISLTDEGSNQNPSHIFLVDLAGSERTKVSGAAGDRLAEANAINKSLTSLGIVLNGLLNKRPFIPYRDSKLTKILAPVFTRQSPPSKVVMIANVSPSWMDVRETVSTLQFAQRVCAIELHADPDTDQRILDKEQELTSQMAASQHA